MKPSNVRTVLLCILLAFLVAPAALAESLAAIPEIVAVGAGKGKGAGPHVRVFTAVTAAEKFSFFAYDPSFKGGVRVAVGDVNGDFFPDVITGAGPGGGPHVKVFHGITGAVVFSFFAFDSSFKGGVNVAAGDVNGDGLADIIVGADKGKNAGAHVKVFSGLDLAVLHSFFAFGAKFKRGVFVAAADFDNDDRDEIICAPAKGKKAQVKVFDGISGALLDSFQPFPNSFKGGVRVAADDLTGDGIPEVITAGGRRVRVFAGATLTQLPGAAGEFKPGQKKSVRVAACDIDGDGLDEIVTGSGAGKKPNVRVFDPSGALPLDPFFGLVPFPGFKGEIFVGGG